MKKAVRFFGSICVCSAAASALPVQAGDSGFFVKAEIGPTITQDTRVKEFITLPPGSEIEFYPGVRFAVGGGYSFADIVALGGETGVSYNTIRHISGNVSEHDSGIGN